MLCPLEHRCLSVRRVEKFHDVTPTSPKVIGLHTLNFKPNFTCSPLIFGGTPVPVGSVRYQALVNLVCVLKFEGPAPPMGRDIVSGKMQFVWVQTHIPFSVDSGPKFTRLFSWNAGGIADDHIAFRF